MMKPALIHKHDRTCAYLCIGPLCLPHLHIDNHWHAPVLLHLSTYFVPVSIWLAGCQVVKLSVECILYSYASRACKLHLHTQYIWCIHICLILSNILTFIVRKYVWDHDANAWSVLWLNQPEYGYAKHRRDWIHVKSCKYVNTFDPRNSCILWTLHSMVPRWFPNHFPVRRTTDYYWYCSKTGIGNINKYPTSRM